MSTLQHSLADDNSIVPDWAVLVPPEFADPFADDDSPGLMAEEWTAPEPGGPTVTFVEWIALQACYFRSLGSDAGDWLASQIDSLSAMAGRLGATTPAEYEARLEIEEGDRDADLVARGYGLAAADGLMF